MEALAPIPENGDPANAWGAHVGVAINGDEVIVTSRILTPVEATVVRTGAVIQIPAGTGGAFIVHRGEPLIFFWNGEVCQMNVEAFCAATGKTLDSMESIFAMDCHEDDVDDDAVLDVGAHERGQKNL